MARRGDVLLARAHRSICGACAADGHRGAGACTLPPSPWRVARKPPTRAQHMPPTRVSDAGCMQVSRGGSAAGDSLDQRRRGAHQVDGPRAGAFRRAIGFGREGSPRPSELLPCVSSRWASARREHVPCVAVFCVGHASDCDAWRLTWSYGRGRNNSFWRRRRCGPNAARVSSLSSERLPTQEQSGRGRRWWRGGRDWTGKRALSPFDTWAPSSRTVID